MAHTPEEQASAKEYIDSLLFAARSNPDMWSPSRPIKQLWAAIESDKERGFALRQKRAAAGSAIGSSDPWPARKLQAGAPLQPPSRKRRRRRGVAIGPASPEMWRRPLPAAGGSRTCLVSVVL